MDKKKQGCVIENYYKPLTLGVQLWYNGFIILKQLKRRCDLYDIRQ